MKVNEQTVLRPFYTTDAEAFYRLTMDSKAHLRAWLGWLDHIKDVSDTEKFIQSTHHDLKETGGYLKSFAIVHEGEVAGTISFNELDLTNRTGALGYWLGEKFQGKGIMQACCRCLLYYGFETIQLNRIEIKVAVNNTKSKNIPEKLGFTKEGRLREKEWLYTTFVDHDVYSLLKREWTQ
ncbi:GNAT family N-acetyltransferase [Salsuginibacillus halophilus]|nr:GNAT family protein [Salsuginibacillus halophilus]